MIRLLSMIMFCLSFQLMAQNSGTQVSRSDNRLKLENGNLAVDIDLDKVSYSVKDKNADILVLEDARISHAYWNTKTGDTGLEGKSEVAFIERDVTADGKNGKRVELSIVNHRRVGLPTYLFAVTLYDDADWIEFQAGLNNTAPHAIRMMVVEPICRADLFPGQNLTEVKTLNGASGFEPALVKEWESRECSNSLLFTARVDGKRYSMVWGGLKYENFYATPSIDTRKRRINLKISDPTGRLVPSGETWWAPDTFYLGLSASDPFDEAEKYGLRLRKANNAHPKPYNLVKQCGWAVGALSNQGDMNNTAAIVKEMDAANACGLTKYVKVAIRLVPDHYCYHDGNTEQGWWDDEHWAKYGHLTKPYETTAKWCAAMKERGGLPFTYFQGNMPSDDFAKAHPDWMVNNDISKIDMYHPHARNEVRMDFTDPGFKAHMKSVWKRLGEEGIKGVFFDYPAGAWVNDAKMDDSLATTVSAYVGVYEMAREGLGEDAFLMERNLGGWKKAPYNTPMLDVTAGIVDLQRTTVDNNYFTAEQMTKCGLRWYKSRSVFNYYHDNKEISRLDKEARRTLITMINVTSGILELGTSFTRITPEMVYDMSRIYPMYDGLKSPRPLDAFTGVKDPMVYDLELTPDYHVLTLFNSLEHPHEVSVSMKNEKVDCGMNLDPDAEYYVYDFWGDKFAGIFQGNGHICKKLNSLGCVVYSVRKVLEHPQVISTNRHVLQGWMDMKDETWNKSRKQLTATSELTEGDVYRVTVALNGLKAVDVKADGDAKISLKSSPAGDNYKIIEIVSDKTQSVNWTLNCKK